MRIYQNLLAKATRSINPRLLLNPVVNKKTISSDFCNVYLFRKLAEIFNVDPMIILCGENSEYEHVVVDIFDLEERKLTNLEKI